MKKRLLLIICLVASAFIVGTSFKAGETANWEFLPLGLNYLQNENFFYTEGEEINQGTIETINYIRIKPEVHYHLYFYSYQDGQFNGGTFEAFDSNKVSLGNIEYGITGESNNIDFITPENAKYIKFSVNVEEDWGNDLNLWNVEINYILADHTVNIRNLTLDDIRYQGPNIDYSPVLSGYNGYYVTNVNTPVDKSAIIAGVKAIDDVDGDISSSITVIEDTYTSNKTKVGTWSILLRATDSSSNSTDFRLYIEVKDYDKPYANGPLTYDVDSTDQYDLAHFLVLADIRDNYDGNMTNKIVVSSDQYTGNEGVRGTHKVVCSATDSSNNRFDFTITVNVTYIDDASPVFTGTFSYNTDKNHPITIATILSNINVNDNVDGDITNKVQVIEDYYSFAPARIGSWRVLLKVTDTSSNSTTQAIIITVSDTIAPSFYLNTQVINIDLTNNVLNVGDFVEILERSRTVRTNCSYKVTYDEYTLNKDKPGEYQVVLDIDGEAVSLTINVIEGLEKKEATFKTKVTSFFTEIFASIKSFFRKLFRFR